MLYPLTFHPLFKERPWGGRALQTLYGKSLPPGNRPIGESWEISDRPDDESVIANGPLAGRSLRWLMAQHGSELLGATRPARDGRFPLLCKILDAREKLSLQVHPPEHAAGALDGEPKTEMWFIAHATPDAELFVGLKHGVTRAQFEAGIADGTVADCFHRIRVKTGDAMFLPSGRVHAIGAGLVIFEIQQNSDTTYRVFDWNRQPARELHVRQSLASIDFDDEEPALVTPDLVDEGPPERRALVRHALFNADLYHSGRAATLPIREGRAAVVAVVEGPASAGSGGESIDLVSGQFCLIPAGARDATLSFGAGTTVLVAEA